MICSVFSLIWWTYLTMVSGAMLFAKSHNFYDGHVAIDSQELFSVTSKVDFP